jgi:hypothetical protein
MAADRPKVDVTLFADMPDDKADFVAMPCEHHFGRSGRVQDGVGVAEDIGFDIVGVRLDALAPRMRGRLFVTGGRGCCEKGFEKGDRGRADFGHGFPKTAAAAAARRMWRAIRWKPARPLAEKSATN